MTMTGIATAAASGLLVTAFACSEDIDVGAVNGDVETANAMARRLFQAAGRALRRRRQMQAAA